MISCHRCSASPPFRFVCYEVESGTTIVTRHFSRLRHAVIQTQENRENKSLGFSFQKIIMFYDLQIRVKEIILYNLLQNTFCV